MKPISLEYQPALTPQDAADLGRLEEEAFQMTWSQEQFLHEFTKSDRMTLIGRTGQGQAACAATVWWVAGEAQLHSMVVHPDYRGQGVGRHTTGLICAVAAVQSNDWITLEVKWGNGPALSVYRAFGFVTKGRRRGYYRDGQDARIMWAGPLQSDSYAELLSPYRDRACRLIRCWRERFQEALS